ncbi:hypothetical protein [Streptomyces sp. NPDC058382]|uniref:hypothetical protein n=1 Tax=unclassified Streptomyces TaxID=2593676 RepID=UPI00363262C9
MSQQESIAARTGLGEVAGSGGPDLPTDPVAPGPPSPLNSGSAYDEHVERWGTSYELGLLKQLGLA